MFHTQRIVGVCGCVCVCVRVPWGHEMSDMFAV